MKKTNKSKNESQSKRKRIVELSSDSEPENFTPKKKLNKAESKRERNKSPKTEKQSSKITRKKQASKVVVEPVKKKAISALAAFGNEPVKQEKVATKPPTELNIHDDEDFEKTLLELDEDELLKNFENNSTSTATTTQESVSSCASIDEKKKTPTKAEKVLPITHAKTCTVLPKTPTSKKRKLSDDSHSSSADADFERFEKKRHSAVLYQKYLNRGGPTHPGSKWLPKVRK